MRRVVAVVATVMVASSFLFVSQASAQVPVAPSVVAEAECAPAGSTQGIVLTFINGNVTAVSITGATATGSLLDGPVALTFDPTELLPEETAQADISVPGTAAGALQIEVEWSGDNEDSGTAIGGFDVTPCTQPTTTSTAAPAQPAETAATFTG
jgi:hypothetical protein